MVALRALPFLLVLIIPHGVVRAALAAGPWSVRVFVFVFVIIPVLDMVVGRATRNPTPAEEGSTARRIAHELPLVLWLPVQLALLVWGLGWATTTTLSWLEVLAITASFGAATGIGGINIAHELMHRRSWVARAVAELLMATVTYTHFCIEHVLGHHRRVGTPEDPATARFGESLWAFLPRTVIGSARSAWRLEARRCAGRSIPWWSLRDRRLRYTCTLVVLYGTIAAVFGVRGVAFFALQSAVAVWFLETVNYVEHYGLARRRLADGRFERVQPWHSWNATHRVTNWFVFNLQRHSDHHYLASRHYYDLRHHDDAPHLPIGYSGMILLATVPPLYRRIMDPRVRSWRNRHVEAEAV